MVGHAFRVEKFPRNRHEIDGRNLVTLHRCIRGGVFK